MTAPENPTTTHRPPKGRSPSFPGIALPTAIERARVVWERYRQFPQPVQKLTDAWGYKSPTTGPASVTYAALRKYGLIDTEGAGKERTAKLSQLGIDVLMKPDALPEIQHAALLPSIHAEMWERFKTDVPTYDALHYEFVVQRGFTETGLREFLREYRETIAFAQLSSSVMVAGEDGEPEQEEADEGEQEAQDEVHQHAPKRVRRDRPGMTSIPVLLPASGEAVYIEGRFPITEQDWTVFMAVLAAMKPGLVRDEAPDPPVAPDYSAAYEGTPGDE